MKTTSTSTRDSRKRKSSSSCDCYILLEESMLSDEMKATLRNEFFDLSEGPDSDNTSTDGNSIVKYPYICLTTPLPSLIQWVKSSEPINPFCLYSDVTSLLLPITAFLIPNDQFIEKVIESSNGLDFTAVDALVSRLRQSVTSHLPLESNWNGQKMRFIFLFLDVDKVINKVQKKVKDKSVPQLFDQVIIHLLFVHNIEIFRCKKLSELSEYLSTITRTLQSTIERNNSSAFSVVMKASKRKAEDGLSSREREEFESRQTWSAMLQMIPLVSKEKANAFISNSRYSCPKKAFDAVNNESLPVADRINEMQSLFGKGKKGNTRQESRLATHVFNLLTEQDSEMILKEDP